jgi:hypothetical protein
MKKLRIILFLIFTLVFFSCQKQEKMPFVGPTILIYMAGDNDLSNEVYAEINAIKAKWGGNYKGRLLIYGDTYDQTPFLIEIKSGNNGVKADTLLRYPEHNSASKETLSAVVNQLPLLAPAPQYGLIVFSHGSGWLPQGTLTSLDGEVQLKGRPDFIRTYSMARDGNSELSLADFAAALPDHFFDYIIFENCFMGGVEVVSELQDKAKWIMGSAAETLSPGFTEIYPELLTPLYNIFDSTENNLKAFAKIFVDHYKAQSGVLQSATMSVFKTEFMPALASWVKNYAPYQNIDISGLQRFDRFTNDHFFFDFQEYFKLISDPSTHAQLDNILNQLIIFKDATPVFMSGVSGSFSIVKYCGLTTYIPQDKYVDLNAAYQNTRWYQTITQYGGSDL